MSEQKPIERLTPGIFRGELAMFQHEDGDYVRREDHLAVVAALQAEHKAAISAAWNANYSATTELHNKIKEQAQDIEALRAGRSMADWEIGQLNRKLDEFRSQVADLQAQIAQGGST